MRAPLASFGAPVGYQGSGRVSNNDWRNSVISDSRAIDREAREGAIQSSLTNWDPVYIFWSPYKLPGAINDQSDDWKNLEELTGVDMEATALHNAI